MDTQSYVIKDFHNSYINYVGDNPLYNVEYKLFREILIDYFKYLRNNLIEEGKEVKLPCRLGTVAVVKHKPKGYTSKSLRVDYKSSRDIGKLVLHLNEHTDGYKYRFYWSKSNVIVTNKSKYQLVMTRHNKRRLAYILKNGVRDYMEI